MPVTLRTTLREIRDDLVLRPMVVARGHIETIKGIDALIGVAEAKATRSSAASSAVPEQKEGSR